MGDVCHDYGGNPACLREVDDRYTMDYRDVEGGGLIRWCAHCGPIAKGMEAALNRAFEERPGFAEELGEAIEKAREENPGH